MELECSTDVWRSTAALLRAAVCALALLGAGATVAAPQLMSVPELVGGGEIKLRLLARAKFLPLPTPEAQLYLVSDGQSSREMRLFNPVDLWRERAEVGTWIDPRGNVLSVGRVLSLPPGERPLTREQAEAKLDELEREFTASDEELAAWRTAWGDGVGRFTCARNGRRYFVVVRFAEKLAPAAAERFVKTLANSLSSATAGMRDDVHQAHWWSTTNASYVFKTDLDRLAGERFIRETMASLATLRQAYAEVLGARGEIPQATVRIFRSQEDYRIYRARSGEVDFATGALWDPAREELLLCGNDRNRALSAMRHEGFHQFVHHATRRGDHAPWFNEGFACCFENVKPSPDRKSLRLLARGVYADYVAQRPETIAEAFPFALAATHASFLNGDAFAHYATAWALVYFLRQAPQLSAEYAPYAQVIPTYLRQMQSGDDPLHATARAWAHVAARDVVRDFLAFWKKAGR